MIKALGIAFEAENGLLRSEMSGSLEWSRNKESQSGWNVVSKMESHLKEAAEVVAVRLNELVKI